MFDKDLVRSMLIEIDQAIEKISYRTAEVESADYFTGSPQGMERLDGIAMLFIAIGESLKNIDKITGGALLVKYPEIDWAGVKGFRDIIAHHYFDIDADQVFWICKHDLIPLSAIIKRMIQETE
jgi:uncharacterized protein with HEPN domain